MNEALVDRQLVIDDIEALERILTRENKALTGNSTTHLTEIVTLKQSIIEKLQQHRLTATNVTALGDEAGAALRRCRKLNEENNLLVNQRLKVVRQANTIYGKHVNKGSVALYDQMGKIVTPVRNSSLVEV